MVELKLTVSLKETTVFQEESSARHNEAILQLCSLMELKPETMILYFAIAQSNHFEDGLFTSRLRSTFRAPKCIQLKSNDEILRALYLDSYDYITSSCFLEDNHLDIVDWIDLYIEDLIRYNPFLENVLGRYPYQESTVNQWFQKTVEQEDGSLYRVNILNRMERHQENDPFPSLDGQSFPDGLNEDGYRLLYHGTSHEFAKNILEDGIDLKKGKNNRDFSHGEGFYLNNNYEEARSWAFRRHTRRYGAVLTYKVPHKAFSGFQQQGINLFNDESEWERITKAFRLNPSNEFLEEMRNISFIEGPMASVSRDSSGTNVIHGVIEGSYQMCILSDVLAKKFDSCLHSVVFF